MTMLPDVSQEGYDEWQDQLFTEDATRKIQGIGFTHQANDQMSDLARIGAWANAPVVEGPVPPPPAPEPQPEPVPVDVASALPAAAPEPSPSPVRGALASPSPAVVEPSPAPASAGGEDFVTKAFSAASAAGADVTRFLTGLQQGGSGDQQLDAYNAILQSGGDLDRFTRALQGGPATTPASTGGGPAPVPGGPLQDYARQAASRAGIDPDIFVRQIQQESGFNPSARSPAGASGVAQIVPKYHPGVDTSDPYASLDYAANLMKSNLGKYGGDYSKALAAYNAGGGAVDKYGGVPPFEETQRYVNIILSGKTPNAPTTQEGLTRAGAAISAANRVDPTGHTFPLIGFKVGSNGNNDPHSTYHLDGGSDLMAPRGTPVVAMGNGRVISVMTEDPNRPGSTVGGNAVQIRGDDGLDYYYAHLDGAPQIKQGDRVSAGDMLGAVGNTGNAWKGGKGETHLHIGIGHGISTGTGAEGGLGQQFNAKQFLSGLLPLSGDAPPDFPRVSAHEPDQTNNPLAWLDQQRQNLVETLNPKPKREVGFAPSAIFSDTSTTEPILGEPILSAASTGQPRAIETAGAQAEAEQSPVDRLKSAFGDFIDSMSGGQQRILAQTGATTPGLGYDPSSLRATEPTPPIVDQAAQVLGLDEASRAARQQQIEENRPRPTTLTDVITGNEPMMTSQPDLAGDIGQAVLQSSREALLEQEADLATNPASTVIGQAKAAGWDPTPDQERIAFTVLSQITPMNVLLSVAGGGGVVGGTGRAAARYLAESALGLGLNIAGSTVAGEVATNAGLPVPVQFGASILGGAAAQLTGHATLAATSKAANWLQTPEGQAALRTRQRAQFSLDPEAAAQAEAAAAAQGPVSGEGLLARELGRLDQYPEEVALPVRQAITNLREQAPASAVARTLQKWMEENPPGQALNAAETQQVEALVQSRAARAAEMGMSEAELRQRITGDVLRSRSSGAVPPEQMPLFGGEVQPRMEAPRTGGFEVPETTARTPEEIETSRQALMRSYLEGGAEHPGGPATDVAEGRLAGRDITRAEFGEPGTQTELGLEVPGELNAPRTGAFEPPVTAPRTAEQIEAARQALVRAWLEDATAGEHPGTTSTEARRAQIAEQAAADTATAQNLSRKITYDDLAELRPEQTEMEGMGTPKASVADRAQNFMTSNMLSGPHGVFTNVTSQTEELFRPALIRALAGYPGEAKTGLRMLAAAADDALDGGRTVWLTGRGTDVTEAMTHAPIGREAPGLRVSAGLDEFFRTLGNALGRGMESERAVTENPNLTKTEALRHNNGRINAAGQKVGATSVFGDGSNEWLGAQISGLRRRLTNSPNPGAKLLGWTLYGLVPFSRIPEAIWNRGLKRSPAVNEAWGTKKMVDGWREGLKTGDWRNYRMAAAETLLDSTINLAILSQASQGNVTGANDPEHPFSIRLPGNKWLGYQNLGPTATRLAVIASIVEAIEEGRNDIKPNVLADIVDKTGALAEKTWYLDSVVGVLDLIKHGNLTTAASKELGQFGDRLTPIGSLANYIEQSTDPVMRDPSNELPKSLWERQQSRIPDLGGLIPGAERYSASQLPPRVSTTTGEPLQRRQSNWLEVLTGISSDPEDPVRHEIARLARPGPTTGFSLKPPPEDTDKVTIQNSEIPLSEDEQRVYLAARGKFLAARGKEILNSDQYQNKWDNNSRARYWQDMLSQSSEAGKAELVKAWGGMTSETTQKKLREGYRVVGKLEPRPESSPTPAGRR